MAAYQNVKASITVQVFSGVAWRKFQLVQPTVKFLISSSLNLGNSRTEEALIFSHLQDRFSRPSDLILSWRTFCCLIDATFYSPIVLPFRHLLCLFLANTCSSERIQFLRNRQRTVFDCWEELDQDIRPLTDSTIQRIFVMSRVVLLSSTGSWDSPFFTKEGISVLTPISCSSSTESLKVSETAVNDNDIIFTNPLFKFFNVILNYVFQDLGIIVFPVTVIGANHTKNVSTGRNKHHWFYQWFTNGLCLCKL